MPYVKGDHIRFYSGGAVLSLELDVKLSSANNTVITSGKADLWNTNMSTNKSWIVSANANTDFQATENIKQKYDDFAMGAMIAVQVGSSVDNKIYAGTGLIKAWTLSGLSEELSKFKIEIQGIGPCIETVYSGGIPFTIPHIIPG